MGNKPYKIIHLNFKGKKCEINEEKSNFLFLCFRNFALDKNYLNKNDLSKLIKIDDNKIIDKLFEIFSYKKGVISLNDLKVLYLSFTEPNYRCILLSFFLFGNHKKILRSSYSKNLAEFNSSDKIFLESFSDDKFIKSIIYKEKSNSKITYLNKILFIENSKLLFKEKYNDFEFIKVIFPSSVLNTFILKYMNMNYVCDCFVEKDNTSKDLNNLYDLEQMKDLFNKDCSNDKSGHLNFKSFEKILKDIRVNQKLINLIIQYLKAYTMKDYINFDDFKYLMSNIYDPLQIDVKKKFLFQMIYTIANVESSIKTEKLTKILQIDDKEIEKKEITLENSEEPRIDIEIDVYLGYMYNLGLLPFLRYNIKPKQIELKKKIINNILNHKSVEEYLMDNFEANNKFYPITIDFWNSIISPERYPKEIINNSIIAEEYDIFHIENSIKKEKTNENNNTPNKSVKNKEKNVKQENKKPKMTKLKKDMIYGKDFVIICGELFSKIKEYFEFDYLIELTKTKLNSLMINKKNKLKKIETNEKDNYLIFGEYIIDFYPVKTLQIIFSELIDFIGVERKEKDKVKEEKFLKEINQINEFFFGGVMDESTYEEKRKLLKEKYKDIVQNDSEDTSVSKTEFLDLFKNKYNEIINNNKNNIKTESRFITGEEIIDKLIKENSSLLNKDNFNIIYSTFDNPIKQPNLNNNFILNGIVDFAIILVDIKNEKKQTILSILENNELKNESKDINYEEENILSKSDLKKLMKTKTIKEKEFKKQMELEKKEQHKNQKIKEKNKIELEEDEKFGMSKTFKESSSKGNKIEKSKTTKAKKKEQLITPPYGITNFGNTCYFNSVNQIFFNLPILQELFSNDKIKYFINKKNKFGHKGEFISAYMPLYKIYPSEIQDKVYNLRTLIANLKDTFNNNLQQDANEYLNFVLESLHEELNLKSSKRYIEDRDDNYKYNDENDLGNIAWANSLRRNASFIDSIFMFQLKSNLTCRNCNTRKVNFESNYVFDLPLSLCRIIIVEINLFRLPFKYKIYYDKINKDFSDFLNLAENKSKNITNVLWNYYIEKLNYEQKKNLEAKLSFKFDYERDKTINNIITLIKNIPLLKLEPDTCENVIDNEEIIKCKINHYTDLIAYSSELNKIIKSDSIIDSYVDKNDKLKINIYEVLNINGLNRINDAEKNAKEEYNLLLFQIKKKGITKLEEFNNDDYYSKKINGITNILSLNNKISYYEGDVIDNSKTLETQKNKLKIITEYPIPIVHYHRDLNPGRSNIFMDFNFNYLNDFPQQFIILNNSNICQITPKYLYNYIWNLNSTYINHPNKKIDEFWWNLEPETINNTKKCYPFVLRIVRRKKNHRHLYECEKCLWYNFCFGCALVPNDEKYLEIKSDCIIFVDWCNSFLKEEIDKFNFECKTISTEEIRKSIELSEKEGKNKLYKSLKDCFDLFFEKEALEDPLYCRKCGGPQDFTKNYEINKLPYVLILSLKRFKFNKNNNFKLKQLITFPLNNFELGDKIYDLYGVVHHYGEINSGHYFSTIKINNKWVMCDDKNVYETTEDKVMNQNAYILFYISKESINSNSYYNSLKSLMQHIVETNKKKNEFHFDDNNNFFKGEPVITPYGEGFVMGDYIEDFKIEEFINNNNEKSSERNEENKKIKDENLTPKNKINESDDNNDCKNRSGMIKIKFDFGNGMINKKNVKKQILIDSFNFNNMNNKL